ncbi:hypothetical protein PoB_002500700 [Plakobranchus ocellatus]|uniref:H15 domain-containing protein n=1 Tax=Plakobranchus ocellatus TaxID=259542 RepID=A0AAV3ZUZ3_9GAST|nr:hypothetical protein PoB_002500700 [Plakobranchus ocellatus]
MDEDSTVDGNNSHPLQMPRAGPSTSVTETYPGTKAPMQPKKSSRMMTKLVNAIRVLGKDKGAPLGSIRNYLVSNDLVSPKTADCKILSTVSEALKKGIVSLGTASDFNWLFRLASAATKRTLHRGRKRTRRVSSTKRKSSTRKKSRGRGRKKRKARKATRKGRRKSRCGRCRTRRA